MLKVTKDPLLTERGIPFALLEVAYPARESWDEPAWEALRESELAAIRARAAGYDRKAVFGDDPYYRYFKKFKKTYPVMQQVESFLLKGRPFSVGNPVLEIPFLAELNTYMLMGTHDVDRMQGGLELCLSEEKTPFTGMRGDEVHTYPNDLYGRDEGGIILSMIAGADDRTCARADSRHVFYPVFATDAVPTADIEAAGALLTRYVRTLAPTAAVEWMIV